MAKRPETWVFELKRRNGLIETQIADRRPRAEDHDGEILRVARADRAPSVDGVEDWDWSAGKWLTCQERAERWEDQRHCHEYGIYAIELARVRKVLEAHLIVAGIPIDGLLAAEAAATGQLPLELAGIVISKSRQAIIAEVGRIVGKREARGEQDSPKA